LYDEGENETKCIYIDWLYGEGEDETKGLYISKLEEMKGLA